ncbi:MAG: M56 family metallopeptidase [Bacteroidales bacterium]|nr:M56 family metallopeptidase [Bacteroidales bacterium]MCB9013821.1 M56 family metallopeptidase [Bacteroidales bacterium]
MNDFLFYALKSIAALGLFALVYRMLLGKEGNFPMRRLYLLSSILLAMILPFFNYSFSKTGYTIPTVVLDEIVVYGNGIRLIRDTSIFPLGKMIQLIYFAVAGILFTRILINMALVLWKSQKIEPEKTEDINLYLIKDKNISYSFFRNIFIGQTANKAEMERIIAHEKIHARQLHSVDVLIAEFLTALFWFNPLMWWYRNEIKNVHEYLADQGALENGFDRKEYQITLLEHLIGSASLSITNNFNYSLIKNRIAMMNKGKNVRKNLWKAMMLIPVSLIIAFAFSCTEKSTTGMDNNAPDKSDSKTAYFQVEQMPEFPGGFDALRHEIAKNLVYPKEARDHGVSGRVFVQFVVDKDGNIVTGDEEYTIYDESKKESSTIGNVVVAAYKPAENSPVENTEPYVELLKKEAVRVISSLPKFEKVGMQDGKAVAVAFTIPINFALQ